MTSRARLLCDLVAWAAEFSCESMRALLRVCVRTLRTRRLLRILARPTRSLALPASSLSSRYLALVPLGKCWRRRVAPVDLTIDKGALPDLLSFERRKEMSFQSRDRSSPVEKKQKRRERFFNSSVCFGTQF